MDRIELMENIRGMAKTLHLSNVRNNLETLIEQAQAEDLNYIELLNFIFTQEILCRKATARNKRIRHAGFSEIKTLEEYDAGFLPGFNKNKLDRLASLEWIEGKYNLIFTGPPGTGKTHLATALAHKAAEKGYLVSSIDFDGLMEILKTHEFDERAQRKLNYIKKSSVILIDEMAYLPVSKADTGFFFRFISEMEKRASFIITTNKSLNNWIEVFADEELINSIVDRLIERCDVIELKGESYRMSHHHSFL